MNSIIRGLLCTISISLLTVWYYSSVQRETVEPTKGAIDYYWAYQKAKGEVPDKEVRWPYNKRTGTPHLAAQLPFEAQTSFKVVNIASGVVCIVLCYLALASLEATLMVSAVCLSPLLIFEWSPLRSPFLYPFEANPPAMALYALAAYAIANKRYVSAAAAFAASCAFRESGVYFGVFIAAIMWATRAAPPKKCFVVLSVSLAGLLVSWWITTPLWEPANPLDNGPTAYGTLAYSGTQAEVIWYFIKYRFMPPHFGIIGSALAILMCLAPFLVGAPKGLLSLFASKIKESPFATSLGLIFISAIMATFGGKETPRIFFAGYPLYIIFLATILRNEHVTKLAFLLLVGFVTHSAPAVMTDSPYWGWIPTFTNMASGRTMPLVVGYLVFWSAAYAICRKVDWDSLGRLIGTSRKFQAGL